MEHPSTSSERVRSGVPRASRAGRRAGYVIAVVVNVALLIFIYTWPGWQVVPFLSAETVDVLPAVTVALLAGIVANVVYLVADPPRLRALGDVVVTSVGLVALVRVWQVFPFAFAGQSFDWALVFRVLLVLGMVGSLVAIVVALVRLFRPTGARAQSS